MVKFLVTGYYGFLNSGDDAILLSMCEDIDNLSMDTTATILSNSPTSTIKEYPANAVYRFNLFYVIREIIKCDVLLMGGGSLLQDKTSTRSLIYYLSILVLSKVFRKKSMIYANGIGPISGKLNRKLTKQVLNKVDLITIRETLSLKELENMGVKQNKVRLTADPVFSLTIKDEDIDNILKEEGIELERDFVTILFRNWRSEEDYITKMAKVCDDIVENKNMDVVFIPMKYPADVKVGEEIAKKMTNKSYTIKSKLSVYQIIKLVGMSKLSLSMRLHALLYSALKDVPMIGFTYDPKVEYFLKELKMYSIINLDNFKVSDVTDSVNDILQNYDSVVSKISEQTKVLSKKAELNKEYLEKLVKDEEF